MVADRKLPASEVPIEAAEFIVLIRLFSCRPSDDHRSTVRTKKDVSIWSASSSLPVEMSTMTRRTQGGGVMGRRSLSPKPHMRARWGDWATTSE